RDWSSDVCSSDLHRGAAGAFADAGDGAEPAHRLRALGRDREEGASRRHDAARGCTRARLRRRRAVRRMGAPARHDGSERLSAGAGAAEAGRRRGSLSILRALWPFLAPYRGRIALAVGALLVAAGATLVV